MRGCERLGLRLVPRTERVRFGCDCDDDAAFSASQTSCRDCDDAAALATTLAAAVAAVAIEKDTLLGRRNSRNCP